MRRLLLKIITRTGFFLIALFLLFGTSSLPENHPEIDEISKRINEFTFDLLKHNARAQEAPANSILSPQSIFHGLAMSYIASSGETRKELAQVFRFPEDNKQLLRDLANLRRDLNKAAKQKQIDISMGNSAWLNVTYADFRKEYLEEVREAFPASLHRVRFKQTVQASKDINKWVSKMTRGRIQEVVSPKDFESRSGLGVIDESALIIINAIYFKGDWGSKFDKTSTQKLPFYVDASKTTNTLMMHQLSLLQYSEMEHTKFLEIPYIGGSYSIYAILPHRILSVKELMDLLTYDMILQLKYKSSIREVDVLFPKFELKSHFSMKDILSDMGVKTAFDSKKADFDKMIEKKHEAFRVYISEIYHDVWIDVQEEGTKAAAVTRTRHHSFGCCSAAPRPPMPAIFHARHPFLFMIVDNQRRSILFAGWVSNPEEFAQQALLTQAFKHSFLR